MGRIDVLSRGGILRAPEVVDLAAAAGLDLAAAATLLAIESNGGRNVWGSDGVSTGGIYVKGSEVTQAAYLRYKAARRAGGGADPAHVARLQDRADAAMPSGRPRSPPPEQTQSPVVLADRMVTARAPRRLRRAHQLCEVL